MRKQVKEFKENKNYTYSGIRKSLQYFFEIKENSIERAKGSLGIVPYVYEDAKKYWHNLNNIKQINEEIISKEDIIDMPIKEIYIRAPDRQPMKHYKLLFTFLNEDKEGENSE